MRGAILATLSLLVLTGCVTEATIEREGRIAELTQDARERLEANARCRSRQDSSRGGRARMSTTQSRVLAT